MWYWDPETLNDQPKDVVLIGGWAKATALVSSIEKDPGVFTQVTPSWVTLTIMIDCSYYPTCLRWVDNEADASSGPSSICVAAPSVHPLQGEPLCGEIALAVATLLHGISSHYLIANPSTFLSPSQGPSQENHPEFSNSSKTISFMRISKREKEEKKYFYFSLHCLNWFASSFYLYHARHWW